MINIISSAKWVWAEVICLRVEFRRRLIVCASLLRGLGIMKQIRFGSQSEKWTTIDVCVLVELKTVEHERLCYRKRWLGLGGDKIPQIKYFSTDIRRLKKCCSTFECSALMRSICALVILKALNGEW